jgi:hypothetical protein
MIRRFIRNDCGIREKLNPRTQEIEVVARMPEPPPIIGLLMGDCVHNLRTALDHIVFALISTNQTRPSGTPNARTMFPIRDTAAGYCHQVEKLKRIDGLHDEAAALIDRLRPYHARERGDDHTTHPLWILDKLENIDKHRRLAMVSGIARHAHISIRDSDGGESDILVLSHMIHDRAVLSSYPARYRGRVQVNGYLMVYVALNEVDELPSLVGIDVAYIMNFLIGQIGGKMLPMFAWLAVGRPAPKRKHRRQDLRMVPRRSKG